MTDSLKYVYVIELEHHYYFIHTSTETNPDKIFLNCEIYYDFIKKHRPVRILKQFLLENEFFVDATVKEYMFSYGIHFVRGGSYIDEILTPFQMGTIRNEFDIIERGLLYENELNSIISHYSIEYDSLEEVVKVSEEIEKHYQEYLFEKSRYDNMFPASFINKKTIVDISTEDIDWLYDQYKTYYSDNRIESRLNPKNLDFSKGHIHKYRNILESLGHLYFLSKNTTFFEDKQDIIQEYEIYLKYPHFLFDSCIYHHPFSGGNNSLDLDKICRIIKWMIDLVKNRIDEYKFDLSTYDTMIEWKVPRILYILEKKMEEKEKRIV